MTIERAWAAALALTVFFAVGTVWPKHTVSGQQSPVIPSPAHTTTVLDSNERALPTEEEDWTQPRVDLNGNEIDAAVGDYRVDMRGEMYERHAPDTALLRLSAPKL